MTDIFIKSFLYNLEKMGGESKKKKSWSSLSLPLSAATIGGMSASVLARRLLNDLNIKHRFGRYATIIPAALSGIGLGGNIGLKLQKNME